jgi:hypothetical protein
MGEADAGWGFSRGGRAACRRTLKWAGRSAVVRSLGDEWRADGMGAGLEELGEKHGASVAVRKIELIEFARVAANSNVISLRLEMAVWGLAAARIWAREGALPG